MEDQDEIRPIGNHRNQSEDAGRPEQADMCCEVEEPVCGAQQIKINALNYGYVVKIGCQDFAVETVEKLIKNLEAYLKDPNSTERKWMKDKKLL